MNETASRITGIDLNETRVLAIEREKTYVRDPNLTKHHQKCFGVPKEKLAEFLTEAEIFK